MGWHISPPIADILEKGGGFSGISRDEALTLLRPALPEELTPTKIGSLQITAQPVTCHLVSHPRGMGMFSEGRYRFVLLKASSPTWQMPWKVASYEPVALATK